jgi:hypothetical protein
MAAGRRFVEVFSRDGRVVEKLSVGGRYHVGMFLRPHYRRRNGQREAYWALVESYRTERGPRQRTVAYLGLMDEAGRLGVHDAADPSSSSQRRQQKLTRPATPSMCN